MIKIRTVLLLILFLTLSESTFSQDSNRVFLPENTMIKKGNCAIVFEIGTMFSNYNTYFEAYNFTIKKHISDRLALRLNIGFNIFENKGEGNSKTIYSYVPNTYETKSNTYRIISSVNFQYFLTKNNITKLFVSTGPYGEYNYNKMYAQDSIKSEELYLGLVSSIGAEIFLLNNLSFIGEYLLKINYNKVTQKYNVSLNEDYVKFDGFEATFNTLRFGLSVYF